VRQIAAYVVLASAAVFLLGGCSAWKDLFGPDEEKTPAELMDEGMTNLDKGRYEAATEAFQNVKDRYPYSRYAALAELKMADALFKKKEYEAAYEAYTEFERLHPKHKEVPYVLYRKGMCHFSQMSTIDRDQSHTLLAKQDFEGLIRRFPRSDYAKKARLNIRRCLIYLAEYELYVGHYYYKMGKYRSAMVRYATIIERYPDMGQYHEAMEYISKCKDRIAQESAED
jgi:outer membrane protein assembly factor BamD